VKLKDKVAIVTGGGLGIGRGIVRCLAEEGADVAIIDINAEAAEEAAAEVAELGGRSQAVIADVIDSPTGAAAVEEIARAFGRVDILVNNVGGQRGAPARTEMPSIINRTDEEWLGSYEINLKPTITMCRNVAPIMIAQRYGKIVNISSIAGRLADAGNTPYATFKAGVISLTWSLSRELAQHNINVNCVCPGWVYTPLWQRGITGILGRLREGGAAPPRFAGVDANNITDVEFFQQHIVGSNAPLGREQTAEDMGRAVAFFASEEARNITGQTLHVDGGFVTR
jgi:meso-butanediol dehydrogenase/(S,S)-butanediol dehydrogenase/diacetyl reductase